MPHKRRTNGNDELKLVFKNEYRSSDYWAMEERSRIVFHAAFMAVLYSDDFQFNIACNNDIVFW